MTKQRTVAWTESGYEHEHTGKLLEFMAFPNIAEVDTLHAIVEMEGGYIAIVGVSLHVLHFTHTADGVEYER